MILLTPIMKRAIWKAAEYGMLHFTVCSGIGKHRHPIKWENNIGRSTIQALRKRKLIYGSTGTWCWKLTTKGYIEAVKIAITIKDNYRAKLWNRMVLIKENTNNASHPISDTRSTSRAKCRQTNSYC